MCQCTRALARNLLASQRQRAQDLQYEDTTGEEQLCFREPDEVQELKAELMAWSREVQIQEQLKFDRCFSRMGGGLPTPRKAPSEPTGVRFPTPSPLANPTSFPRGALKVPGGDQQRVKLEGKMMVSYNRIGHTKWREMYGSKTVDGTMTKLCWFFCNRPGGCNNASCNEDHVEYPHAYKGKPLMQNPKDFQEEVVRKCAGA